MVLALLVAAAIGADPAAVADPDPGAGPDPSDRAEEKIVPRVRAVGLPMNVDR